MTKRVGEGAFVPPVGGGTTREADGVGGRDVAARGDDATVHAATPTNAAASQNPLPKLNFLALPRHDFACDPETLH
jgi:hypothetical protein